MLVDGEMHLRCLPWQGPLGMPGHYTTLKQQAPRPALHHQHLHALCHGVVAGGEYPPVEVCGRHGAEPPGAGIHLLEPEGGSFVAGPIWEKDWETTKCRDSRPLPGSLTARQGGKSLGGSGSVGVHGRDSGGGVVSRCGSGSLSTYTRDIQVKVRFGASKLCLTQVGLPRVSTCTIHEDMRL